MGVKVRERNGDWYVFIDHKGRRKARKCASKRAAELARDQIDARLKLGQYEGIFTGPARAVPTVPTFAEYAERWLTTVAPLRLKASSLQEYRARVRLRLLPVLGDLPLDQITRETVRNLIGDIVRMGNFRSTRPTADGPRRVSRGTIREAMRTLATILATAEEDGVIAANPARKIGRYVGAAPAGEVHEIEVFDREELARVLEAASRNHADYYPLVLTLARTGMRLGEAIALQWEDVDQRTRRLLVRRSRRKGRISEPKNGRSRRVDMSAQLANVLRGLQSVQQAEAIVAAREPAERVFSTPDGRPIDETSFRRVWAAMLNAASCRYRKAHVLRHTFASLLLAAGETPLYVQEQLGHHSAAFTLKVYGHLIPPGSRRAVDVLDDATAASGRNLPATESLADHATA